MPAEYSEHLEKIPYLLTLFLPIILFFLLGLGLAWLGHLSEAKRLRRVLDENSDLVAKTKKATNPETELAQKIVSNLEARQEDQLRELKAKQDELFIAQCKVRDLSNRLSHHEDIEKVPDPTPPVDPIKEKQIRALTEANAQLEADLRKARNMT